MCKPSGKLYISKGVMEKGEAVVADRGVSKGEVGIIPHRDGWHVDKGRCSRGVRGSGFCVGVERALRHESNRRAEGEGRAILSCHHRRTDKHATQRHSQVSRGNIWCFYVFLPPCHLYDKRQYGPKTWFMRRMCTKVLMNPQSGHVCIYDGGRRPAATPTSRITGHFPPMGNCGRYGVSTISFYGPG
jgi:hypothetical protein